MTGSDQPTLLTAIPGPRSRERVDVLARHECPAITARRARRAAALGAADDDPVVWAEAVGANVKDVDGNLFVDLTAGFGVALIGHRHPRVVDAAAAQGHTLLHAMGDAFPDVTRIALLERLAGLAPAGLEVAILGLSGADAVEAAVKTAVIATGRDGVLVFEGAYHGLALGALGLQAYNAGFTAPFRRITHPAVRVLPYGCPATDVANALADGTIGMVLVEPVQGRGGMRAPPDGWLAEVASLTRRSGALFACDEILTGLGRTGSMWAHGEAVPDLLCTGKALAGGFPLSACLGTRAAMDAWGASTGEAIHTQTFLGHPVGCAAALAALDVITEDDVPLRAASIAARLSDHLGAIGLATTGRGLVLGIELPNTLAASRKLLQRGYIAFPAGRRGEVLGLTPSAFLTDEQVDAFVATLAEIA